MIMNSVTSSNIDAVGYDPDTKVLQVDFKSGTSYQYEGVPANLAQAMIVAPSVGQFFYSSVKYAYPYTKV